MLSRDGKRYMPFPAEIVERAMLHYDPAYYQNPHAIQNVEWGQDRINFQAWPYPSATHRIIEELRQTTVTGDTAFLKDLTGEHVVNDLFQYEYVRNSLEKYPDWTKDPSVPQTGNPFEREEVIRT